MSQCRIDEICLNLSLVNILFSAFLQLTNALMDFVIESNSPFSIINQPSLQKLLELVSQRKIEIPSTKYFMERFEKPV